MIFDFDPGRYGAFIWPAYAVTALVFLGMIAETLLRTRRWKREAERLEAAREDLPKRPERAAG
jgi:heme exporter protein D